MRKIICKSYSELLTLPTFEERYNYLKMQGSVGAETFGSDRYLNQKFYKSKEWESVRDKVIIRDNGRDMGLENYPIKGDYIVHHINPLTLDDIQNNTRKMLDMNNLILVSSQTHKAIHYGDDTIVKEKKIVDRAPFDTCPWRKNDGK